MSKTSRKGQILYFSHGGGPLPLLGDASHEAMIAFLKGLPALLHKPEAIVVISAHWEEPVATVLSSPNPPMFYDYYGFPAETYTVTYPAPGSPALARTVETLLQAAHIPTASDTIRGFDHGVFIPLMMMYPEADIPTTQLSLVRGLNALRHLELGRALAPLMEQNVLVIGSGFSFHNMAAFTYDADKKQDNRNEAFQDWLKEVCTGPYTQQERENFLLDWEQAPSARYCHPREEHLLPLLPCVAMGREEGKVVFDDYILGKRSLAFLWD